MANKYILDGSLLDKSILKPFIAQIKILLRAILKVVADFRY